MPALDGDARQPPAVRAAGAGSLSATLDRLALRVVRSVREGAPLARSDARDLHSALAQVVGRFALSALDRDDIAATAIVRFVSALQTREAAMEAPAAYLMTVARNLAIDRLRQLVREPARALDSSPLSERPDPRSEAEFSGIDSREQLRAALADAAAAEEHFVVAVIGAWLDLAATQGGDPTARQVAAAVGSNHTAVLRALHKFRGYADKHVPDSGRAS